MDVDSLHVQYDSAVSPRSESVMRTHQRAGLLALGDVGGVDAPAMHVVKAMTSWFVTFSISSMRSTVKSAWSRIHCASCFVMPA